MAEYSKCNVKLTDIQVKKTENCCKNKTGATLRLN